MYLRKRLAALVVLTTMPIVAQSAKPQYSHVDRLASARSSTNEGEIGEIVDAVFAEHGIAGPAAELARPVRHSLIVAEGRFDRGEQAGVSEEALALAFNRVAESAAAPTYTRTYAKEIHRLRIEMFYEEPHMIGRRALAAHYRHKTLHQGLLPSSMSPVEAFHVASSLFMFKMFHPAYQLTQGERIAAVKQHGSPDLDPPTSATRRAEMQRFLHTKLASVSLVDVYGTAISSVNTMNNNGGSK